MLEIETNNQSLSKKSIWRLLLRKSKLNKLKEFLKEKETSCSVESEPVIAKEEEQNYHCPIDVESCGDEENCCSILKKSQTDPTCRQSSPSHERHATFVEVVKVHEYDEEVPPDSDNYYTSDASLNEEADETPKRSFFLDQNDELDEYLNKSNSPEQVVPSVETSKSKEDLISKKTTKEKKSLFKKSKLKNRSSSLKSTSTQKKKTSKPIIQIDDLVFDFAC